MRKRTSHYKGVSWRSGKWEAKVRYLGKDYYIGRYGDEKEAGLAYNNKRFELQGNYAKMNELSELIYCPSCNQDLSLDMFYPDRANKYVKGRQSVCIRCHIKLCTKNQTNEISRYATYVKRHFGSYGTTDKKINKLVVAQRLIKLMERGDITREDGRKIFNAIQTRKDAIQTFKLKLSGTREKNYVTG